MSAPARARRAVATRPAPARAAGPRGLTPAARWLVAIAIFLPISKFHGFIPILATIRTPLLVSVAALAMLFANPALWRPADLVRHWIPRCVAGIVAIAVVGAPLGIYPGQSVFFLQDAFITTILLALMAFAGSRTARDARFLLKTVALACITAALLALEQGRTDSAGRLAGAFGYDPNDLALVCLMGIPLTLWWILHQRGVGRWLLLATLPTALWVVIRTDSRGGFLALCGMVLGFLILGIRARRTVLRRAAAAVLVVALAAFPFLPESYRQSISTITDEGDYNRTSESGRVNVWKRGMGYAFSRPVFGVGIANFNTAEGRLSEVGRSRIPGQGFKWSAAHNSFVQIAAELGLIGGSLFLVLVLGGFWALTSGRLLRFFGDPMPGYLGVSLAVFAVGGFFLSFAYYDITWMLFGTSAGLLLQVRYRPAPVPVPAPAAPVPAAGALPRRVRRRRG